LTELEAQVGTLPMGESAQELKEREEMRKREEEQQRLQQQQKQK
jgi:hypothetical protein